MTFFSGIRRLVRRNRGGRHHVDNSATVPINYGPRLYLVDRIGRPVGRAAVWRPPNRGRHAAPDGVDAVEQARHEWGL